MILNDRPGRTEVVRWCKCGYYRVEDGKKKDCGCGRTAVDVTDSWCGVIGAREAVAGYGPGVGADVSEREGT